jgi:hypothetical protein
VDFEYLIAGNVRFKERVPQPDCLADTWGRQPNFSWLILPGISEILAFIRKIHCGELQHMEGKNATS